MAPARIASGIVTLWRTASAGKARLVVALCLTLALGLPAPPFTLSKVLAISGSASGGKWRADNTLRPAAASQSSGLEGLQEKLQSNPAGMEEDFLVADKIQEIFGGRDYAVGIKIQGTHIAAGLVNPDGMVEIGIALPPVEWKRLIFGDVSDRDVRGRLLIEQGGSSALDAAERITREAVRHILFLIRKSRLPIDGFKQALISFGGPVDRAKGLAGVPDPASNIPGMDHYPLRNKIRDQIRNALGTSVKVDLVNDMELVLFSETGPFGTAPGVKNAVVVGWGTGFSAVAMKDGIPFTGGGSFVEIGHTITWTEQGGISLQGI